MFTRFSALIFFFLSSTLCFSQILQPAKLVAETPTQNVKVGDEIELIFNATIDKGWYIYTVGFDADCGPIPMSVKLEKNPGYQLVGGLIAVNDRAKHDKIFDCDVKVFIDKGQFKQKIKILSADLTLTGSYEGQVCSEEKCVLFSGDLLFDQIHVTGKTIKNILPSTDEPKREDPNINSSSKIDTIKLETPSASKVIPGSTKGPVLDKSILGDNGTATQNESLWGYMIVAFFAGTYFTYHAVRISYDPYDGDILFERQSKQKQRNKNG